VTQRTAGAGKSGDNVGLHSPGDPMLRQPLLSCVLLVACAAAHAEWKLLTESAFGSMTYDPASVHAAQGRTQMQYRIDFAQPRQNAQGKVYASSTMTVAVDCKQQTVSLVDLQTNAGPKGQGAVVDKIAAAPSAGEKVTPNSSNEQVYKAACGASALPVAQAPAAPAAPAKK
jgi:hypothetical protein